SPSRPLELAKAMHSRRVDNPEFVKTHPVCLNRGATTRGRSLDSPCGELLSWPLQSALDRHGRRRAHQGLRANHDLGRPGRRDVEGATAAAVLWRLQPLRVESLRRLAAL